MLRLEREPTRSRAARASRPTGHAQRLLTLQATAGNAAVARAVRALTQDGCAGGCGCGGSCGGAERVAEEPRVEKATTQRVVVQRATCAPNDPTEWFRGTPGQAAARLAAVTGGAMNITGQTAKVLCCAFCQAQQASLLGHTQRATYTALFNRLVRDHVARLTPAAAANTGAVHLDNSYFLPVVGGAPFVAAAGGIAVVGGPAAYLLDAPLYGALRGLVIAHFPAQVVPGHAARYGVLAAALPGALPPAPAALPVNASVTTYFALVLGGYLGFVRDHAAAFPAALQAVAGTMRRPDVVVYQGGGNALLDAKFSYRYGRHDAWGVGQQAAYQSVYQDVLGGPGGTAIPLVTWDACDCINQEAVYLSGNRSGRKRRREDEDDDDSPPTRSTRSGTAEEHLRKRQRTYADTINAIVSA